MLVLAVLHALFLSILAANLAYLRRTRSDRAAPDPLPSVSVLIPARNEAPQPPPPAPDARRAGLPRGRGGGLRRRLGGRDLGRDRRGRRARPGPPGRRPAAGLDREGPCALPGDAPGGGRPLPLPRCRRCAARRRGAAAARRALGGGRPTGRGRGGGPERAAPAARRRSPLDEPRPVCRPRRPATRAHPAHRRAGAGLAQRAVLARPGRRLPPPRAARRAPGRGARRRQDRPLPQGARHARRAARPPRRPRRVDVPEPRRGVGRLSQERLPAARRHAAPVRALAGAVLGGLCAAAARLAVVPGVALPPQGRDRFVGALPPCGSASAPRSPSSSAAS